MIWWITQPGRARAEMATVAELAEGAAWLADISWGFGTETRLTAEFTIRHQDETFPLKLVYPSFFPDTPPQVLPRENIRLSGHQWGKGGELCLELRADNWHPSYTGAMMIESAYHLLSGERPTADTPGEVPSAHNMSLAQSIRGETCRLLLAADAVIALSGLPANEPIDLELSEHDITGHWLIQPTRLGNKEAPIWSDTTRVMGARTRLGVALHLDGVALPSTTDIDRLETFLVAIGQAPLLFRLRDAQDFYLLLVGKPECRLVYGFQGSEKFIVLNYTTLIFPDPQNRLATNYGDLSEKAVAVAGAGSLGSKVAVSLARSGVRRFILIDEDILNPDNLVRNDLDARAVGLHKVDGLAARLREVNPDVDVKVRRIKLGGQESAASTESALKQIGGCDLVIDATADPQVFNLCASVARSERKPMIWGEVFAGGIGGLIARSRPDIEPPPHAARRQISDWFDAQGVEWEGQPAARYDLERENQPPLIADDADVSVIAGHVARFALDTLLYDSSGAFPASAYVIGFVATGIFAAPFDTVPITFAIEGAWGPTVEPDAAEQLEALVAELFPEAEKEPDAA